MKNSPKVLAALKKAAQKLKDMPQDEFDEMWAKHSEEWEQKKIDDPAWVEFCEGCARSIVGDDEETVYELHADGVKEVN